MQLYYHSGACSLSPHIVARELGLPIELVEVARGTHRIASGEDFFGVNANGYVPALKFDDGSVLTEGPAIVQALAEMAPGQQVIPAEPRDRLRVQSLLNYITAELHKPLAMLMNKAYAGAHDPISALIDKRFDWIEGQIEGTYLLGARFTAADAYLFVVQNWTQLTGNTCGPKTQALAAAVAARPSVQAAMAAEDMVPRPGTRYFLPQPMLQAIAAA